MKFYTLPHAHQDTSSVKRIGHMGSCELTRCIQLTSECTCWRRKNLLLAQRSDFRGHLIETKSNSKCRIKSMKAAHPNAFDDFMGGFFTTCWFLRDFTVPKVEWAIITVPTAWIALPICRKSSRINVILFHQRCKQDSWQWIWHCWDYHCFSYGGFELNERREPEWFIRDIDITRPDWEDIVNLG